MKKIIAAVALLVVLVVNVSAQKSEIFAPGGKAIRGYDPVAFFKESKPVMGTDSFSMVWKEANWLFSTKENMQAFKENPEKFCPQYGGYCAYGTSEGHKAPTQADTWTIAGDKLYFNYNTKVKQMWMKDQEILIKKADVQWMDLKTKP
ncbi:MAG: YHS domain-containing (seleno)protein [Sediminibacterium sp.]